MKNLPDGIYTAKAKNAKMTKTSDGVNFVEVELFVLYNCYCDSFGDGPCARHKDPSSSEESGVNIHWRSPLTKGGTKRTFFSLLKMGAKMNTDENDEVQDPLEGVGSKSFLVEVINIECDENEAPGSFKTFAKVVL